jgi:hypothetical protein
MHSGWASRHRRNEGNAAWAAAAVKQIQRYGSDAFFFHETMSSFGSILRRIFIAVRGIVGSSAVHVQFTYMLLWRINQNILVASLQDSFIISAALTRKWGSGLGLLSGRWSCTAVLACKIGKNSGNETLLHGDDEI